MLQKGLQLCHTSKFKKLNSTIKPTESNAAKEFAVMSFKLVSKIKQCCLTYRILRCTRVWSNVTQELKV